MPKRRFLYKVIYDHLKEKIVSNSYKVGDLLPSEKELEDMFHFSRTPVRQALKELENEGYIYRLQGQGSFVANRDPVEKWTMLTGFEDSYSTEWKKVSAKTIDIKKIKDPRKNQELGLSDDTELIYLERVRYFNGEPLIYMEHHVPAILPIEVFQRDPFFVSAISKIIKEELSVEFNKIEEEIDAITPPVEIARYLHVPESFPILKIIRKTFADGYGLVDYNVYYVRTDTWKYRVKFKGE